MINIQQSANNLPVYSWDYSTTIYGEFNQKCCYENFLKIVL